MPIIVEEKFESRAGDNQSLELVYFIQGTDDDGAAKSALAGACPATHGGLPRQDDSIHVDPVGPGLWDGRVRYALTAAENSRPETGESTFSFDTGGGAQHITQSLQTIARYAPAGQTAPDFQGAVGVTHDSVEGVDITVPVYQFAETHYLSAATVTDEYKGKLFALTGKVNNAAFRGCSAGECLFLGASGSKRGVDGSDWEITFRFAASPNRTNFTVGGITVAAKKGWEYMWVRYEDTEDAAAKAVVKRPTAVYIEKVYELGDYSQLGIGS